MTIMDDTLAKLRRRIENSPLTDTVALLRIVDDVISDRASVKGELQRLRDENATLTAENAALLADREWYSKSFAETSGHRDEVLAYLDDLAEDVGKIRADHSAEHEPCRKREAALREKLEGAREQWGRGIKRCMRMLKIIARQHGVIQAARAWAKEWPHGNVTGAPASVLLAALEALPIDEKEKP